MPLEKNMCLNSVGELTQMYDWENRKWRWRQIKSIYIWYLDLAVKRLHCTSCLNAWATNCVAFWNQKLCCGTVFLHKNDEKKNSSGLHQKRHVFCLGQIELIWVRQEGRDKFRPCYTPMTKLWAKIVNS